MAICLTHHRAWLVRAHVASHCGGPRPFGIRQVFTSASLRETPAHSPSRSSCPLQRSQACGAFRPALPFACSSLRMISDVWQGAASPSLHTHWGARKVPNHHPKKHKYKCICEFCAVTAGPSGAASMRSGATAHIDAARVQRPHCDAATCCARWQPRNRRSLCQAACKHSLQRDIPLGANGRCGASLQHGRLQVACMQSKQRYSCPRTSGNKQWKRIAAADDGPGLCTVCGSTVLCLPAGWRSVKDASLEGLTAYPALALEPRLSIRGGHADFALLLACSHAQSC